MAAHNNELKGGESGTSGFHISACKAFILLLVSCAVCAGVGLVVHFTEKTELLSCQPSVLTGETESTSSSTPFTPQSASNVNFRIPLSLIPLHYNVDLKPNLYDGPAENFTFEGNVRIKLRCDNVTNKVFLHTNKLTIIPGSVEFYSGSGEAPSIVSWAWDKGRQLTVFQLDADIHPGNIYDIKLNFTGPLKGDLKGLYLSSNVYLNTTHYQATTQFSPTDARKAFPSFDEPSIKSTFDITLVRKGHMTSLSNMPRLRSEDRGNGWIADIYSTTPKMATYVLAFIVCDFDYLETTTENNITFKAWSRPEAVNQTRYALDIGARVLTYFEEYFHIPFPLPKQDMIAIPDIAVGGMENWGLITFRETAMMYEPGVSSEANKQRVAEVVSHEVGHMWFGDLVSPAWWDDLWLKEGFACFLQYLGADHLHPEWNMFEQFVTDMYHVVMESDSLVTSHPLYVPVDNPDEINEIFDSISYNKGAVMVRMMRFFIGEETFRRGMTRYLNQKAYDSAFHDELFQALTEQAQFENKNIDVRSRMETWLLQMNYPVVMVTRAGGTRIKCRQQRFLLDPNVFDTRKYNFSFGYRWDIPFTFTSSMERNFEKKDGDILWLWRNITDTTIDDPAVVPADTDASSWILANPLQYGYYRVNYDENNWRSLIQQLKTDHAVIPAVNRAQIINDAWQLAKAGILNKTLALQTVEYLHQERSYVPWKAALTELDFVGSMLSSNALYGAFQAFMRSVIKPLFSTVTMNITVPDSTHLETYVRSTAIHTACRYGVKECTDDAQRQFTQWMSTPSNNTIDPELKSTVYCTAIRLGGQAEWDFAFERYKSSTEATETSTLLSALACSSQPWILSRLLSWSLLPEEVRAQDALSVLSLVAANPVGKPLAWGFFRQNWGVIKERYGSAFFAFSHMIRDLTANFNSKLELQELRQFLATHAEQGSGRRALHQAVETIEGNIRWMDSHVPSLNTWLYHLGFHDYQRQL